MSQTEDLTAPLREALEMVRNDQAGSVSKGLLNAFERKGLVRKVTDSGEGGMDWIRWEAVK